MRLLLQGSQPGSRILKKLFRDVGAEVRDEKARLGISEALRPTLPRVAETVMPEDKGLQLEVLKSLAHMPRAKDHFSLIFVFISPLVPRDFEFGPFPLDPTRPAMTAGKAAQPPSASRPRRARRPAGPDRLQELPLELLLLVSRVSRHISEHRHHDTAPKHSIATQRVYNLAGKSLGWD